MADLGGAWACQPMRSYRTSVIWLVLEGSQIPSHTCGENGDRAGDATVRHTAEKKDPKLSNYITHTHTHTVLFLQ